MAGDEQRIVTTHIMGLGLRVGSLERQRCAWCGEIIEDVDLADIATPDGKPASMLWECGALLEVTRTDAGFRGARVVSEAEHGGELPSNCCTKQPTKPRLEIVR